VPPVRKTAMLRLGNVAVRYAGVEILHGLARGELVS
jgi:hypothetical protein